MNSCSEAPAVSVANIGHLDGSWTVRLILAGRFFLNMASYAYVRLHRDDAVWRRSFAGRGLEQLNDVRDAIVAGRPPGTAMFIHVLLPHSPLEVDAGCRVYSEPHRRAYGGWNGLSEADRGERLKLYGGQVRCVHRAVADLIAAIDSTAGREHSIIIVHGDHGSRMRAGGTPLDELSEPDLNAAFSTLLAVRRPGVAPSVHTEPVPVQDYFWDLVERDFRGAAPPAWTHYVRAGPADPPGGGDTLRVLTLQEMAWARRGR